MWLLLACVETGLKPAGAEPAAGDDTDTGVDTADRDDTGEAPDNPRCEEPGVTLTLTPGVWRPSGYASVLLPDLDGGGAPDIVYEGADNERSFALVRGEDLVGADPEPFYRIPSTRDSPQAGVAVSGGEDFDGDGLADVLVGEFDDDWSDPVLSAWSVGDRAPRWTVSFPALPENGGAVYPARGRSPDVDGDGAPEVAVASGESVYVFAGPFSGSRSSADATVTVQERSAAGHTSFSPVVADLDADGLDDVLLTGDEGADAPRLFLLPGALAAGGGTFVAADLVALVIPDGAGHPPLPLDLDDDGADELFVQETWTEDAFTAQVRGYAGADVADAARTGATLDTDDAFVTIGESEFGYLGARLALVTDDVCLPGLAVSAHFNARAYLFSNAVLRLGGTLVAEEHPALTGTGEWFGYTTAGGQDLDGDGTLDLIVGPSDMAPHLVFLAPARTAAVP